MPEKSSQRAGVIAARVGNESEAKVASRLTPFGSTGTLQHRTRNADHFGCVVLRQVGRAGQIVVGDAMRPAPESFTFPLRSGDSAGSASIRSVLPVRL